MGAAWEELEEGWAANKERMAKLKVSPRTEEEGMIRLNVGGSSVGVFWHLLAEVEGFEDSDLGSLLGGVWEKGRVPRDADGRIVLDESPACMKQIVHNMLTGRATSVVEEGWLPRGGASSAMAIDEAPCLIYTAHVMGLLGSVPTHPKYTKIKGGSTILEPCEIAPLGAKIREWVGGSAGEMTLLYRATRDGFGSEVFNARCTQDSPQTVSLIRVSSGQGNCDETVVGGYATHAWGFPVGGRQYCGAGLFLFMLKDGSASRNDVSMPILWKPHTNAQILVPRSDGPYFGASDLVMTFDKASDNCSMQTKQSSFPFGIGSPFLALNGKKVVEIEVYRYSTPAPTAITAPNITQPGGDVLTDVEVDDVRSFGESIASSLMEERVVLVRAVKELEGAHARVTAAAGALETVYGPSVAAGEQDAVVELNVRGARMTTLRSTLQACPHSALATMFNEVRWPAAGKDKDKRGRRLIDCSPTCFSKILDVLRMRKRSSWGRGVAGGKQEGSRNVLRGGVFIQMADLEVFGEAVNMYFPGCESFIMDMVQTV